jgi:hypothetical protein
MSQPALISWLLRQVVLEDWLKRPRRERVFDNLMRLTSSLQ